MKKFILIILMILLIFSNLAVATKSENINVMINNKLLVLDVEARIIEGRTVLPARAILEALGLSVSWDPITETITGSNDNTTIKLQINKTNANVNNKTIILDVPAMIIDERTLIPARFVAEATGSEVNWNDESNTVIITTNEMSIEDKIEWKYGGYEQEYPYKEYEFKWINGIKTDETRYNGKNNEELVKIKYPFDMTETQISNAIEEGKKGFTHIRDKEEKNYKLIPTASKYNMFVEGTQLITPQHLIERKSALFAANYKEYLLKDAIELNQLMVNTENITFEIIYNGTSIDTHQNINVILKQGDKIFEPYSIEGQDTLASTTDSWPEFPAYVALLNVMFSNPLLDEKIDYSKDIELIIVHAPEIETIYRFNFNNYK